MQPAIALCFCYFVVQTTASVGLQTFLPSALNAGLAVPLVLATSAVTAYLLGGTAGIVAGGFLAARTQPARRRRVDGAPGRRVAARGRRRSGPCRVPAIVPLFALVGFAMGSTGPSRDLIVRNATPKGAAGRVYGFVYSGLDLGAMIGPVWFGLMLDHALGREMFYVVAGAARARRRRRCSASGARSSRPDNLRSEKTMDLGIAGRRALVCAASKGLGRGCAEALAREGVDVTILARTAADVERAAAEIGAAAGRPVAWLACDITTPEGRAAALAACPDPDILVNNAGGPPPGDFRDWDRAAWIKALDANMLTPIELIRATVDGMIGAQVRPRASTSRRRR